MPSTSRRGRAASKPRNPVARLLQQATYRAKQTRSKKLYERKPKHRGRPLTGPDAVLPALCIRPKPANRGRGRLVMISASAPAAG
jgi:hypothetical protein